VSDLTILWEDHAVNTLMARDRYTRQSILDDFRRNPNHDIITFDSDKPDRPGYLTPVVNGRYRVVWYHDTSRQLAVVRAIVPLPNVSNHAPTTLKGYVQRAVEKESKGEITL
jgi:hypothetical protein